MSSSNTAPRDRDPNPLAQLNTILQRLGQDPPKFRVVEQKSYTIALELSSSTIDLLAATGHTFAIRRLATICKGRKSLDIKKAKRTIAGEACEILHLLQPSAPTSTSTGRGGSSKKQQQQQRKNNKTQPGNKNKPFPRGDPFVDQNEGDEEEEDDDILAELDELRDSNTNTNTPHQQRRTKKQRLSYEDNTQDKKEALDQQRRRRALRLRAMAQIKDKVQRNTLNRLKHKSSTSSSSRDLTQEDCKQEDDEPRNAGRKRKHRWTESEDDDDDDDEADVEEIIDDDMLDEDEEDDGAVESVEDNMRARQLDVLGAIMSDD